MKRANKTGTWASDTAGAQPAAPARVNFIRLALVALSMFTLLAALWAGLLRLGWALPAFYVHSALLQLSLLVRIAGDLCSSYPAYECGVLPNMLAVLVLVANTAAAVALGMSQSRLQSMRVAIPHPDAR